MRKPRHRVFHVELRTYRSPCVTAVGQFRVIATSAGQAAAYALEKSKDHCESTGRVGVRRDTSKASPTWWFSRGRVRGEVVDVGPADETPAPWWQR